MTYEQTIKRFQIVIGLLLILTTCLVVFHFQIDQLRWIKNYSVQIMLGMLTIGLFCLVLGRTRLMFTSLLCCSLLCLFLQSSTNNNLVLPAYSSGFSFKIAHANLTNVSGDLELALESILQTDADFVSLQEVNFSLNDQIAEKFSKKYPYHSSPMKKNDFWSIKIFSKLPLLAMDTFYVGDIPNLQGSMLLVKEEQPIHFISSYILPPFNIKLGNETFKGHLDQIVNRRGSKALPYFVVGDFNVAGWYDEIQDFRVAAKLKDSRRGYLPAFSNLFSYPVDHIFFSEQLVCVDFDVIKTETSFIGISGIYQLNSSY